MSEPWTDRRSQGERSLSLVDISTMPRSGLVPTWVSRVSWGSIFAGLFVAVALQLALSALGVWAGFGLAHLTSLASVRSAATGIAVWIGISTLISLFVAGLVAARLSNSVSMRGGLWHGLTMWGVGVTAMTGLSAVGFSGLLGFGLNGARVVAAIPGIGANAGVGLTRATSATATYSGYYLLFAVLSLVTALAGGYVGSFVLGRRAAALAPAETAESDEAMRTRRAA
jgi:hypothetical protein